MMSMSFIEGNMPKLNLILILCLNNLLTVNPFALSK